MQLPYATYVDAAISEQTLCWFYASQCWRRQQHLCKVARNGEKLRNFGVLLENRGLSVIYCCSLQNIDVAGYKSLRCAVCMYIHMYYIYNLNEHLFFVFIF